MNNVLDLLAVLIAFSAIMLLLSLLVTTLVQALQHWLALRARCLRLGLQALLEDVLIGLSPSAVKELTQEIIERARFTPTVENTGPGANIRRIFSDAPKLTWIEPAELVTRLQELRIPLGEDQLQKLNQFFARMEDYTSKRFVGNIRWATILAAIVVGFVFQVNSPKLLQDLSVDPQLRARYVNLADGVLDRAESVISSTPTFEQVSEEALARLQQKFPDLAPQLEQATGMGADREAIVRELDTILAEELPERRVAVVAEYQSLLDELHGSAAKQSVSQAQDITNDLAKFDIVPWKHGWGYYKQPINWLGLLITTALLTLGAPFWFETLKNLSSLRDILMPEAKPKAVQQQATTTTLIANPERG